MLSKTIAALPLLAVANAVAVEPLDISPRGGNCGVYGCMLSYFGSGTTAVSMASQFCTNYLTISTATLTNIVTAAGAVRTVTSTATSVLSVANTLTTTNVLTITSTPTTSVTSTQYCTPSSVTGNYKAKRGGPPGSGFPTSSCSSYSCTPQSPSGATCGSLGLLAAPALLKVTGDNTLNACRNSCISNSQCQSFSFFQNWGPCNLFTKPMSQMNLQYSQYCSGSPLVHYDRNCFSCSTASSTTTAPTKPATYSIPSQYSSIISSACSCLGVTTPTVTATSTTTGQCSTTTQVTTTVTTANSVAATVVSTVTTTSVAPTVTTVVANFTLPSTQNGTYTNSYGDTFYEYPGTDFVSGDLMQGTCYENGGGFNVSGTLVPCNDYYGCQDVCSYVNRNGYTCLGVTYTPNPSGFMPQQYSTCYLKNGVPGQGVNNCGDIGEAQEKDSAILISRGSN